MEEKFKSFPDFKKCNIFYSKCSVNNANISNQSTVLKGKCSAKRTVTFVNSDSEDNSEDDEACIEIMVQLFLLFIKNGGNDAY